MLQFVTNPKAARSVEDQVRGVIEGGCRWVEINMPDASDQEIENVVNAIMPVCIETETFLLLSGRAELAKRLNIGGVRLYKHDILPSQARVLLGAGAVIGVTANTIEEVESVKALDIDYIALGPIHGKEDERIGFDGVSKIVEQMHAKEIEIASVAFGGINRDNILEALNTRVNGIVVSDALAYADDIAKATAELIALIS